MRAVFNVAWREARSSSRLLILCMLGLAVLALAVTAEYPTFRDRMLAAGRRVPAFLRKIMEERSGGLRFESFVAIAYLHPVTLALMACWPMARASRSVAGDIERGSLGWQLAYPIGRGAFLAGRMAVVGLGIVLLQLAFAGAFRASLAWYGLPNAGPVPYLWLAAMGSLLYGAMTAWVFAISAGTTRLSVPATAGAAIVLAGFLLENVGDMVGWLRPFRFLSPYHYYRHAELLAGKPPEPRDVVVLGALLLAGVAIAAWRFTRRDLTI